MDVFDEIAMYDTLVQMIHNSPLDNVIDDNRNNRNKSVIETLLERHTNSPECDYDGDDDADDTDTNDTDIYKNNTYQNLNIRVSPTSIYNHTIYTIPPKTSADARKVWESAKIPNKASLDIIEYKLSEWVINNTDYKIDNGIIYEISWTTPSGNICQTRWSTFVKWILCASQTNK